jgi:tRNA(fMet)-specific endonuclease VapC
VSRFVLDTDHLTLLLHGHPLVRQRVAVTPPDDLAITIITVEEQLRGWLDAVRRHAGSERQVWAYRGLHDAILAFAQMTVLDFDDAARREFLVLRRRLRRAGAQDLRIAAITRLAGAVLVTRNQRDFGQVPGLPLQDWTGPAA